MALLDVGHRPAARGDGVQEIELMPAIRRCHVPLQVLLGLVLRVLLLLEQRLAGKGWLLLAVREEIVTIHAHLERAAFAVDGGAPRIFRVGRWAPGAMLPDDGELVEIESRGLRVGDVRFAVLLDEDAAGRRNALRPAEFEGPAHHVEHVDAHIADDAVAVFREGAPGARMNQLVVRAHRRWAGPHFVIEVGRRLGVGRVLA